MKNKSFYRVTQKGWSCLPLPALPAAKALQAGALLALQALQAGLWLEITSTTYFRNPIISKNFKLEAAQLAEQPSRIEEAYDLISRGLSQITRELAVIQ